MNATEFKNPTHGYKYQGSIELHIADGFDTSIALRHEGATQNGTILTMRELPEHPIEANRSVDGFYVSTGNINSGFFIGDDFLIRLTTPDGKLIWRNEHMFESKKEESQDIVSAVVGLTKAVERLCDLMETQMTHKQKPQRVEWHDTFHDDTPFSVLKGWSELPTRDRNAMMNVGLVTFGELKKREDMHIANFGKMGIENLKRLLSNNGVVVEYFPVLN
jgi:hypothetical protein